jgi:hypothetical protein
MRSELKKAIELAPHFVEATDMLASANLMKNVEIPDTVERLVKALSFAPGRDSLVLQLAFAISRTQQRERARPILQDLLARQTLAPPLRQSAENLVQYLDRVTAADAQVRALPNREVVSRLSEVEPAPVDQSTPAATGPFLGDKPPEQLAPGTARLRGVLTLLDCKDGVTLSLLVEGKTLKLHSATPSAIKFTTFNAAVSSQIACGPTPGKGVPASILYRIAQSGESLGEPLAVDFVED